MQMVHWENRSFYILKMHHDKGVLIRQIILKDLDNLSSKPCNGNAP
jgi:hypothetical protein